MADTQKKYLDAEGVAHLWGKISMQDYPNNETLIAVIDAIDETKQNKEDETLTTKNKTIVSSINELNEVKVDKDELINLLNIDYNTLAFNTSEIIISREETTAVLGQAMLGKMVLA